MSDRIKCSLCNWRGTVTDRLCATNPFNRDRKIYGCPQCKEVYGIVDIRTAEEDGWTEVAHEQVTERCPQSPKLRTTDFTLRERAGRWVVEAVMKVNDSIPAVEKLTEGRGDSPQEACDAIRSNIYEWVKAANIGEINTALRRLCYTAEDVAHEEGKRGVDVAPTTPAALSVMERKHREALAWLDKGNDVAPVSTTTSAAWAHAGRGYADAVLARRDASDTKTRTIRQVEVYCEIPLGESTQRWYSSVQFSDGSKEDKASPLNVIVGLGRAVSTEDVSHAVATVVLEHGCTVKPGEITAYSRSGVWAPAPEKEVAEVEAKEDRAPVTLTRAEIYLKGAGTPESPHAWIYLVSFSDGKRESGEWDLPIATPDHECISKAVSLLVNRYSPMTRSTFCDITVPDDEFGKRGFWNAKTGAGKDDNEAVTVSMVKILRPGRAGGRWSSRVLFSDGTEEHGEWPLKGMSCNSEISGAVVTLAKRHGVDIHPSEVRLEHLGGWWHPPLTMPSSDSQ